MTRVSVVMAAYNGERFIAEQIRSIFLQTRPPDELIVVDDASTDLTPDILARLQEQVPHIKVVTNSENLGVSHSFTKGVLAASGDIVFFSDQDDVWLCNKVETHLSLHLSQRADLVFTDSIFTNEKLAPVGQTKMGVASRKRRGLKNEVAGSISSFRNDQALILYLGACSGFWRHDNLVHLFWTSMGNAFYCTSALTLYRRHELSLSRGAASRLPENRPIYHRLLDRMSKQKGEREAVFQLLKLFDDRLPTQVRADLMTRYRTLSASVRLSESGNVFRYFKDLVGARALNPRRVVLDLLTVFFRLRGR